MGGIARRLARSPAVLALIDPGVDVFSKLVAIRRRKTFMHIFLITLRNSARTKPGLDHFRAFDIDPQVVYGVSGKTLAREIMAKIYLHNPVFRRLKLADMGCYLSHQLVLMKMLEEGISRAFVFEDDARFLQHPKGWLSSLEAADFGTSSFSVNLYCEPDPARTVVRKSNAFRIGEMTIQTIDVPLCITTAYFISLDYARERLLHAFPIIRPIDMFGYLKLNSTYFIMYPERICAAAVDSEIGYENMNRLVGRLLRRGTHVRFAIDRAADWATHRWLRHKFWQLNDTLSFLTGLDSYR